MYPIYRYGRSRDYNENRLTGEKPCKNLEVGDNAPDFILDGVLHGQRIEIDFSNYRGSWALLLFYPGDFTFV